MFQSSILPEELESLQLAAFDGPIHVIDREGPELEYAVKYLKRQKIIGFDTESRPTFTPSQPHYGVSLLQLSGAGEAFLFRVKLLGMDERICRILADERIVKVGAAVKEDIRGIQKYRDFEPKNFIDLQKIVWEYGIRDKSVKKMSAIILGVRISKTQQLSNWEAEKLSEAQQKYAATDAWICREMLKKLNRSEKNPLPEEEQLHSGPKEKAGNPDSRKNADKGSVELSAQPENQEKKKRKRRYYKHNHRHGRKSGRKEDVKNNTEKR